MSQNIAQLGCSTIAEAQAELQWNVEDWQQHPSLCHRFLACTSRGMQIEWTAIHERSVGKYKQHQSIMSQNIAHLGCFTIEEAQAELQWNVEDWQQHPSLCHRFLECTFRGMQIEWMAIQNADTPILTDGLMRLMPLSNPTAFEKCRLAWSANVATRDGRYGAVQNWIHYGWDDPDSANEVEI